MMDRTVTTDIAIWTYSDDAWVGLDLIDFEVEATDGGIGKVHEATNDVSGSYIVVDTGPWIFGKKVLLPAGVVDHVDLDERHVHVNLTKDQIQNAPEFDESTYHDDQYRDEVASHYGRMGANRPAGPDYGRDDRTDPIR